MTEPNQPGPTPSIEPDQPAEAPQTGPASPAQPPPPDRPPATDWREPPWFPPRDRDRREQRANLGAIVVGLLILAIGVYYFLDRTVGIAMPRIQWGSLWPILLIVFGGLILIRAIDRRS